MKALRHSLLLMIVIPAIFGSPINRQAGISENVYITVQNDTYGIEQRVCSIESMTYEDGESIPTSSPCEHCICRPPGFACTIISCEYRPGCKALKRSDQCCPEYQCECEKNGKIFQNGEKILDDNNPCEICYCHGGNVNCAVIDCYWRTDCQPRYIENRCCPLYDHCSPPSEHGPIRPTRRPTTFSTTTFSSPMTWFNMSSAIYATPSTNKKPIVPTTTSLTEVTSNYVTSSHNSVSPSAPTFELNDLDSVIPLDSDKSNNLLHEGEQSADISIPESGSLFGAESVSEQSFSVLPSTTQKLEISSSENLNVSEVSPQITEVPAFPVARPASTENKVLESLPIQPEPVIEPSTSSHASVNNGSTTQPIPAQGTLTNELALPNLQPDSSEAQNGAQTSPTGEEKLSSSILEAESSESQDATEVPTVEVSSLPILASETAAPQNLSQSPDIEASPSVILESEPASPQNPVQSPNTEASPSSISESEPAGLQNLVQPPNTEASPSSILESEPAAPQNPVQPPNIEASPSSILESEPAAPQNPVQPPNTEASPSPILESESLTQQNSTPALTVEESPSLIVESESIEQQNAAQVLPIKSSSPVFESDSNPLSLKLSHSESMKTAQDETVTESVTEVTDPVETPAVTTSNLLAQNNAQVPVSESTPIETVVDQSQSQVKPNTEEETKVAALSDEVAPIISDGAVPEIVPLVLDEHSPEISVVTILDDVTSELPPVVQKQPENFLTADTHQNQIETTPLPLSMGGDSVSGNPEVINLPEIQSTEISPTELDSFPTQSITTIQTGSVTSSEFLPSTVVIPPIVEPTVMVEPLDIVPSTTVLVSSPSITVISEETPTDSDVQQVTTSNSSLASAETDIEVTTPQEEVSSGHEAVTLPAVVPDDIPGINSSPLDNTTLVHPEPGVMSEPTETVTELNSTQNFDASKPSQELKPPTHEFGEPEPIEVSTDFVQNVSVSLIPPQEDATTQSVVSSVNTSMDDVIEEVTEEIPIVDISKVPEHLAAGVVDEEEEVKVTEKSDVIPIQNDVPLLETAELVTVQIETTTAKTTPEIEVVVDEVKVDTELATIASEAFTSGSLHKTPDDSTPPGQVDTSSDVVGSKVESSSSEQPIAQTTSKELVVFDEKVNDLQSQQEETTAPSSNNISEKVEVEHTMVAALVRNVTNGEIEIDPIPNDHEFNLGGDQSKVSDADVIKSSTTASPVEGVTDSLPEQKYRLDLSIFSESGQESRADSVFPTEPPVTEGQVVFEIINPRAEELSMAESVTEIQPSAIHEVVVTDVVTVPARSDFSEIEVLNADMTTLSPPSSLHRHYLPENITVGGTDSTVLMDTEIESIPTDIPVEIPVSKVTIPMELIKKVDPISDDIGSSIGNSDFRSDADNEVSNVDSSWYWRTYEGIRSLFPTQPFKSSRKPRSIDERSNSKGQVLDQVQYWGLSRLLFW